MRNGCIRCIDFTSEWADISISNVGLKKGKAIIIVRTNIGGKCLDYAIREKTIEENISIEEVRELILDKERRKRVQEIDSLLLPWIY